MNPVRRPRLLPWTGPEGKPCHLIGDGTGRLSRLADQAEAVQLGLARRVLEPAHRAMGGPAPSQEELHTMAGHLIEALRDTLLVAEAARNPDGEAP